MSSEMSSVAAGLGAGFEAGLGARSGAKPNETKLRIRPATAADALQIGELEQQLFPADAWSSSMIAEELNAEHRAYFVLADGSDNLHGYAGVLALGGEADVQTIAVSASWQGLGWGKKLLEQLIASAKERGAKQLFLEVRVDNQRAITLYSRMGFAQIGRRPRYYQPEGVDALVMRLLL